MEETKKDMISYEILARLGVLSKDKNGWSKELRKISWNNKPARYDIRSWKDEEGRMTRGIGLSASELLSLGRLIEAIAGDLAKEAEEIPEEAKPKK